MTTPATTELRLEVEAGMEIGDAVLAVIALATEQKTEAVGEFNGIDIVARPDADPLYVEQAYWREKDRIASLPKPAAAPKSWLDREPANIHEALARAMVELPGIDKGGRAAPEQGSYAYRGIEQITAAAQAVLGQLGVVAYPIITGDPIITEFMVNSRPWTETKMRIRYRFVHGPSGSHITVGGKKGFVAIARDNSDKGANKCMTQAYKYALLQTLMIGDKNDDVDAGSPQGDAAPVEAWQHFGYQSAEEYDTIHNTVVAASANLEPEQKEEIRQWLAQLDPPITRRWPLPAEVAERLLDRAQAIVQQSAASAPDVAPTAKPEGDEEVRTHYVGDGCDPPHVEEVQQDEAKHDKAPSMKELQEMGATPEDIDMGIAVAEELNMADVTIALTDRNLSPGGTLSERKRRLAAKLAAEYAQERSGASIHPITGSEAAGDESGATATELNDNAGEPGEGEQS